VTFARLSDQELYRLTRRTLQQRPADPVAWEANIDQLRLLAAEVRARTERRASQFDSVDAEIARTQYRGYEPAFFRS
jgi:hypothetical protein